MNIRIILLMVALALYQTLYAQSEMLASDSLSLAPQEQAELLPDKVLHAEPLYIDLIRDLGARKGEKEWNIGLGLTDNLRYDSYEALVEYEFAPIDRLGLEVELPFSFHSSLRGTPRDSIDANRLESLKVAAQWTFLVKKEWATSMALGYIHEFELSDFRSFARPLLTGNKYNPFLVVAKRWGTNFHSLIYTGPQITDHFHEDKMLFSYDLNTSVHYMISHSRNFIGIEFNKTFREHDFDMTIRPQMRLAIMDNLMIGIVGGIPIFRENERMSSFVRLIWEPGHRKH
ncbi:phosphoribosylformylglycinamidine synthase [Porifericola rhodea]|uniref:HAEPLYID family protein n=1 Tax=Porifericola rhodea TaxID=930972 RepID=UPI0026664D8A|nr:HAEPLYID family protein [Porifericola rhodea]WKN31849.1 phosphoribosylformylglycinamidine synthase [Porifericola rhodea]